MRRVFWIVALVAVVGFTARWYVRRAKLRALNSGAVYVRQQTSKPKPLQAVPQSNPAQNPQVAATAPSSSTAQPQGAALAPPSSDTIARNPPNGMVFAGSGKFQLYRQGDITWRLDTESGNACIIFATNAQWSRTRVYQHGCATHPAATTISEVSSPRGLIGN